MGIHFFRKSASGSGREAFGAISHAQPLVCIKSRKIRKTSIIEDFRLHNDVTDSHLLIVKVAFTEGAEENYLVPVSFENKITSGGLSEQYPQAVIAELVIDEQEGILYDGMYNEKLHHLLFP